MRGGVMLQAEVHWLLTTTQHHPEPVRLSNESVLFSLQDTPPDIIARNMPAPLIDCVKPVFNIEVSERELLDVYLPVACLAFRRLELTPSGLHKESAVTYYASSAPFYLGKLALAFGPQEYTDSVTRQQIPEKRKQSEKQRDFYERLMANRDFTEEMKQTFTLQGQTRVNEVTEPLEITAVRQAISSLGERYRSPKQDGA